MNQATTPRKAFPFAWAMIHLLILLMAVLLVTGQVDLAWPLDDPFQEAEWAINRPQLVPAAGPAVLIHGGLDQVPARLAGAACPEAAQIACLRGINLGFQLAAGWSLVGLVTLLSGLGSRRAWCASLPAVSAVLILSAAAATPVAGQQSAPGIRDLPVFAALLPMILISRRLDRAEPQGWAAPAWLGAIAAVAPFWTYNRGIATILVAGIFALGATMLRRSPRPVLHAAAGGLCAIAILTGVLGPPAITATIHNIVYWGQNGALWRIPLQRRAMAEAALPFAAALVVLFAAWCTNPSVRRPGTMLLATSLGAVFALYIAQSLDRADPAHLRWALWPATLLLTIGIRALPPRALVAWPAILIALLTTVQSAATLAEPQAGNFTAGWLSNFRVATSGWPADSTTAGPALTRVANIIRAAGRCTFAANNAGMVYLLARQPPCTRFAVGAYVAASAQYEVIASLATAQPTIILWDAPHWWAHIDGHTLADHAPALAAWIVRTYPVETRVGDQILRSKTALDPESRF